MPSPSTAELPVPTSWDEFEDIVADVMRRLWGDPYVTRNGRQGQAQDGIDIYGYPTHLGGTKLAGVQCRNVDVLTEKDLRTAAKTAQKFKPPLVEFVMATTAPRDALVQALARRLSKKGGMRVHVRYWSDISLDLSGYPDLLEKHFPGFMRQRTKMMDIARMLLNAEAGDFTHQDDTFTYSHDVQLQLVEQDSDQSFSEPWATRFPNPNATKHQVHVMYGGVKLDSFWFVSVDSARYTIPFPVSREDLRIDRLQYRVAQFVDVHRSLDEGLRRAGIQVVEVHERSKPSLQQIMRGRSSSQNARP